MEQLADYPFIQAYMAASAMAFVWFGLAIQIAPKLGPVTGGRVLTGGLLSYLAALAGATTWALLDGQWARFAVTVGAGALFEMAVFVAVWLFIVYFMAARNLSDDRRDKKDARPAIGRTVDPTEQHHA